MAETLSLPGFVNAHSHAFQRSMRGRVEGGDFWAWRDAMLVEAGKLTPVRSSNRRYAETYREMLAAGFTAVGEFHYVGVAEGFASRRRGRRRPSNRHRTGPLRRLRLGEALPAFARNQSAVNTSPRSMSSAQGR